MKAKQR